MQWAHLFILTECGDCSDSTRRCTDSGAQVWHVPRFQTLGCLYPADSGLKVCSARDTVNTLGDTLREWLTGTKAEVRYIIGVLYRGEPQHLMTT